MEILCSICKLSLMGGDREMSDNISVMFVRNKTLYRCGVCKYLCISTSVGAVTKYEWIIPCHFCEHVYAIVCSLCAFRRNTGG